MKVVGRRFVLEGSLRREEFGVCGGVGLVFKSFRRCRDTLGYR